jgi:hopene-associated glycosyltransferase HpnB
VLAGISAAIWWGILLAPWRPWSTRERLADATSDLPDDDFADLTVLIPARDEAAVLPRTLAGLARQGGAPRVIVIDDESTDRTAEVAAAAGAEVIPGQALPAGWTGKLWALEQGRKHAATSWLLLLDADIELQAGTLHALRARARQDRVRLVSLMARLRMESIWERLLMPAFIYFFKLLYPFALANSSRGWIAAGAGGCALIDARVLAELDGFGAIRDAVIDDCALARAVKSAGHGTWIGLSKNAVSRREYDSLNSIRDMVARTAFTQLRYSPVLLGLCTLALIFACWMPVAGLFWSSSRWLAVAAWIALAGSYIPTLRYYERSPLWCLAMPLIGTLYLAMTWESAFGYWRGIRSRWKSRDYGRQTA